MEEVWVLVEHRGGKARKVSLELLSESLRICEKTGARTSALLLGSDPEPVVDQIAPYADRIYITGAQVFSPFLAEAWVDQVCCAVEEFSPSILLAGATPRVRDFLPRAAARLGAGIVTEATSLSLKDGGGWRVVRPFHGGKVFGEMAFQGGSLPIVTFRPNTFSVNASPGKKAEVVTVPAKVSPSDLKARFLGKRTAEREGIEITEAEVVVAGGRGMGGPENFHLLEDLAQMLKGAVGASRAVVDSGWRNLREQVGKSGKTVSPTLYLACGISGAIHHVLGMDTSKVVVAINRDREALIFQHADIGIVGNVLEAIPAITRALQRVLGGS